MQPSLFDLPPAPERLMYQPGSDTSKAAAEVAVAFASTQRDRVLTWLTQRGHHGGTQIEAHEDTAIARHSLTFRFRELVKQQVIEKLDDIRGGAHVYRARA